MKNQVIQGDSLDELKKLPDNCIDSIVTDPPYHLVSIVKRFGKEGSKEAKIENTDGSFSRLSKGFMGKQWDGVDESGIGIAQNVELWQECLRVLKPGGHLLAFSGTRTYHRMTSAIEDAGFEVRDMIEWVYGSGFPKSFNIAKAIDKMEGVEHPKNIPISDNGSMSGANYTRNKMEVQSDLAKQWEGWGTALKPAHEPICMARKPLAEKTVAENCLKWGTGGINIDESRIPTSDNRNREQKDSPLPSKYGFNSNTMGNRFVELSSLGRFPANLIHDNSEEVRECFPNAGKGNGGKPYNYAGKEYNNKDTSMFNGDKPQAPSNFNDSGNASRFFKSILYYPKASKSERNKGCEGLFILKDNIPNEDIEEIKHLLSI